MAILVCVFVCFSATKLQETPTVGNESLEAILTLSLFCLEF